MVVANIFVECPKNMPTSQPTLAACSKTGFWVDELGVIVEFSERSQMVVRACASLCECPACPAGGQTLSGYRTFRTVTKSRIPILQLFRDSILLAQSLNNAAK
jgi:hypothetical protein